MDVIIVESDGNARAIYSPVIDPIAKALGRPDMCRASNVNADGMIWHADLSPVGGPILGPFDTRGEAVGAELTWLREHGIPKVRGAGNDTNGTMGAAKIAAEKRRVILEKFATIAKEAVESGVTGNEAVRAAGRWVDEQVAKCPQDRGLYKSSVITYFQRLREFTERREKGGGHGEC